MNAGQSRPRRVTWLAAGYVLAGALQLLGSQQFAQQARAAAGVLPAALVPWLRVSAGVYGIGGLLLLAAAVGLILMRRWGWWLGMLAPGAAAVVEWGLRIALVRSAEALAAWPVDSVLTVLALIVAYGVLAWPSMRRRFRTEGG